MRDLPTVCAARQEYEFGRDTPIAYLITFRTYGSWLHGDERGSVDRDHDVFGTAMRPPNPSLKERARRQSRASEVTLDMEERSHVLKSIHEVCSYRGWELYAVDVRSNHLHAVVAGSHAPERMLIDLKARATRVLRELGLRLPNQKLWSRHGSTVYLWTDEQIQRACHYVAEQQDDPGH